MPPDQLALLIPIGGIAIVVVSIIMGDLKKIARMRVEEAQLRSQGGANSDEVQALRSELESVQRELSELNERVDFAERLLARGGSPDATQKEVRARP